MEEENNIDAEIKRLRRIKKERVDFLSIAARDLYRKDIEEHLMIIDNCDLEIKKLLRNDQEIQK